MTKTDFPHGDVKFYYQIHVQKQKALGLHPVAYVNFYKRLRKGFNLYDAIHKPRVESQVRKYPRHPIQDGIRRAKTLKDENIPIVDFEKIDKVLFNKRQYKMPKYNMKPPKKKSLLQKIAGWIKKK